MITNVYMIRHAESPFVFGEEQSRGLSEEGFAAAKKVADLLDDHEIHVVAASTYTRAIQTVIEVAQRRNLSVIEFDELRERPIKGLDYKAPWEELLCAIKKSFIDFDYALAGGETTRQAQARAIPIIQSLLHQYAGRTIAIGTHGNIMTIIMNYFDQSYGYEFWNQTSKPDIYKLAFLEGRLASVTRIWDGM
jgi:2,3-bisphosphoglycerate-dependent phosphoglycerate mutase